MIKINTMKALAILSLLAAGTLFLTYSEYARADTAKIQTQTQDGVMLAQNWKPSMDIKGWWISEKLDGVRGCWTGSKLVSRKEKEIHAPRWFTKGLPPFPLDGELWSGRGKFNTLSGTVRKKMPDDGWKQIKYYIFDVPRAEGGFEARLEKARAWFKNNPSPHAELLEQKICTGEKHLMDELIKIEAAGGEGLMLRKSGSPYTHGRSHDLLKVKTFHDTEACVVGHLPGKGKHRGRMGALLVELPNGIRFAIGTGFSDIERENPPPIGSTITFKYKEFNKSGVPRFASFLRIRKHLTD